MSRPAESPVGLRNTLPGGRQPERLVRLAPVADVVEPLLDDLGVGRCQAEGRIDHDVPPRTAARLEPAVAIAEPEVGCADDRLRPVRREDTGRLEDVRHVAPHARRRSPRPRHRPCPGWPARTPVRSGRLVGSRSRRAPSGRRLRRCSARRPMREPSARTWITRPRTPASAMTRSLPRPRIEVRDLARAGEADECPQLEARCARSRTGRPGRRRASS